MGEFGPGFSHIGILLARLETRDTSPLRYMNDSGRERFQGAFEGATLRSSLEQILGNGDEADDAYDRLLEYGSIIVTGHVDGTPVKYHVNAPDIDVVEAIIVDVSDNEGEIEHHLINLVNGQTRASFENHEETGSHLVRINYYSGKLAELLGLSPEIVNCFYVFAELHDVGKMHFGRDLLDHPGELDEDQWASIKKHPTYGAKIIGEEERLNIARDMALGHHEKWDGSGYPNGLAGEAIPLAARIVAVADVFDALVSRRSYKPASSYEDARRIMTEGENGFNPKTHFDPKILRVFLDNFDIFREIHQRLSDTNLASIFEDPRDVIFASKVLNYFREQRRMGQPPIRFEDSLVGYFNTVCEIMIREGNADRAWITRDKGERIPESAVRKRLDYVLDHLAREKLLEKPSNIPVPAYQYPYQPPA